MPSSIVKITAYFGAQEVPDWRLHEAERALQRIAVVVGLCAVWLYQRLAIHTVHASTWFVVWTCVYALVAFFHWRRVRSGGAGGVTLLYAFVLVDPFMVMGILVQDPETFAFLHPFLIVTMVRTGLRYGIRMLYLSWAVTLVAACLLATSSYWREETELTSGLLLMLASVPLFFASLTRRVHNVRAIEAERARFTAMQDVVAARSSFLAKLAHELRSPLQGIVSALDVLAMRRGGGSSSEDELIGRIRRSSLLLNTHLRDLLTLAKGEAGHLEIRPEPFDACSLVESVAASAKELAVDKGLELVIDLPRATTFVVADSARIDQVLTNLVINSVRYTASGEVRIALQPYDREARLLRFTVSDTGPGIPEDILPTLLSPDLTESGSQRRGEGSGIGLAIVRTLVDHLGGRIRLSSQLNQGTSFSLEIPAEPADLSEVDESPSSPTGRILIVDDRQDVLDALQSVSDELGFECDRATSAAVAANLLASRGYDAVLLDVEMPTKTGPALAADTRRGNGPNRTTRFIGMSAGEIPADAKREFDVYLAKPIDHAALRHALLGPGHGARPSQPGLWADTV